MSQHYSDVERESDTYSLPDVETFYMDGSAPMDGWFSEEGYPVGVKGWFYWYCLPGCLPDSDPMGPFDTEAEALEDARDN
jgi:hypothetical protein